MSNTIIVKKTASKKTAKKTAKKAYLFNEDVWGVIMSFVGTPQQFIHKQMGKLMETRNATIRELREWILLYPSPENHNELQILKSRGLYDRLTPIVMTLDEYKLEGFKYHHLTLNKYVDIYDRMRDINVMDIKDAVNYVSNPLLYTGSMLGKYFNNGERIYKILIEPRFLPLLPELREHLRCRYDKLDLMTETPLPFNYILVISNPKKK